MVLAGGAAAPSLAASAPNRTLRARAAVASTLMAALELARSGEAGLEQQGDFAAISMRANAPADQRHGREPRIPPGPGTA